MELKHIFSFFIIKNIFISLVDGYLTLSELTSSVKYNASEMPQNASSQKGMKMPLSITVSTEIQNANEMIDWNEVELFLVVDMKVKLSWYDNRLNYTDRDLQTYIYTKDDKAIWTPYLVWITDRNAKTNVPYTYFHIYPNALVVEFVSVSVTIKYALSSAAAGGFSIRLVSLNHTIESLTLKWNETNPVEIAKHFKETGDWIPLKNDFHARTCDISVTRLSRRQGGDHSCLEMSTEERMHKSSSIFIVYAPGITLVIISWSCFWMEPSSVLGRAAVLLACLLHLFIQKTSITKDLFMLRNIRTLAAFLDGCLVFIFTAFFQTIWITYLHRTTRIPGDTRLSSATTIQEEEEEGIVENSDGEANTVCNHFHFPRIWFNRFPSTPDAINAICRVGFPLCFVIFACTFFSLQN